MQDLSRPAPAGAALTKVDDTNVTLALGGTPATALLQAASITAGWTGVLAEARGGTGDTSLAAAITALGLDLTAVNLVPVLTRVSPGSAYNHTVPASELDDEGAAYLIFALGVSGAAGNITATWDGTAFATQAASAGADFGLLALVVGDGAGGVKTLSQFLGGGSFAAGSDSGTGSLTLGFTSGTTGSLTFIAVYRLASEDEAAAGSPGGGGGGGLGPDTEAPLAAWWDASLLRELRIGTASAALLDGGAMEYLGSEVMAMGRGGPGYLYMRQTTGANQPTFRLDADSSGYPGVEFDGTNDALSHIVGTDTSAPQTLQTLEGEQWWVIRPHASLNLATFPTWAACMESAAGAYLTLRHHTSGAVEITFQSSRTITAAVGRTITFANSGSADTVTFSSGDLRTDGFKIGDYVTFAGTTSNNGLKGPIAALTATVMTFDASTSLVNEGPKTATTTVSTVQSAYGSTVLTLGNTYLIRLQNTRAGGWRLWVNGSEETLTFTSGANHSAWFGYLLESDRDSFTIGHQRYISANNQHWRGWVHEGRIYQRALADAEASALTTRLTSKWGL